MVAGAILRIASRSKRDDKFLSTRLLVVDQPLATPSPSADDNSTGENESANHVALGRRVRARPSVERARRQRSYVLDVMWWTEIEETEEPLAAPSFSSENRSKQESCNRATRQRPARLSIARPCERIEKPKTAQRNVMKSFELTAETVDQSLPGTSLRAPSSRPGSYLDRANLKPWHMSLSSPTRPRCPGCGARMIPKAVRIALNVATCDRCDHNFNAERLSFFLALESLAGPSEISRSHHVMFWTPPSSLPDVCAFARWLELHGKLKLTGESLTEDDLQRMFDQDDRHDATTEHQHRPPTDPSSWQRTAYDDPGPHRSGTSES